MNQQYAPPTYGENAFNCPTCSAYTQQEWYEIKLSPSNTLEYEAAAGLREVDFSTLQSWEASKENGYLADNLSAVSKCFVCEEVSVWIEGKIVYPNASLAPLPSPDMPEDVAKIYTEARTVSALSSTASTALLRLAVEKLLPQVGAKKAKIDVMIGELVSKGLSKEVEKALDSLRVIGNEAVHPGTIDLQDNNDVSIALFKLLNVVVDRMITQPNEINEIYSLLPENKLKGIADRNSKALKVQKNE